MSRLFTPLKIREIAFRNRVFVSPMCQYSSENGMPNDWHMVHLGSRAVGGAGLVTVEATAVTPEGRISPKDSGIWSENHARAFRRITDFVKSQGAVPGIQLAHAGRKASTQVPWLGHGEVFKEEGGWQTVAPSALSFGEGYPMPVELSKSEIEQIVAQFKSAAEYSRQAGFEVAEIHAAHGYLMHEFLSPLSNIREDEFGGSLENRMRFPLMVAKTVRETWPENLPVFARISVTDWMEHGWDLPQSIEFSRRLKQIGVDLIDCSSGGLVPGARIPAGPGYQTPFAAAIRREVEILTSAVGLITDPAQAEHILVTEQADVVTLARQMLRDPYWPLHAAHELGDDVSWPPQYLRAKPAGKK